MTSASYRSPFTATQWQELEHQALIYKYLVSGVPIPPDLIYTVRRSLDSSLSSRLLAQPSFGRKADPEPWRCRRTDGKKWRCSKEAHPDSKYCEKHMHRGKNRSRKLVEVSSSSTPSNNRNFSPAINAAPTTSPYSLSSSITTESPHSYYNINAPFHPFLHPHSSTSKSFGSPLSPHRNPTHQLFLDPGSSSSQDDKDYRSFQPNRAGVDERAFFEDPSGSGRGFSYQPLSMNPYYSQSELQHEEEQRCFVWGTDFKSSSRTTKTEPEDGTTQKPLHQFFGEWPPKDTESWL